MPLEHITLPWLAALIVAMSPVLGCIVFLYRLWSRFEKLEKQGLYRQEDMAMVFKGLRGCLEGLIQGGANGEVKGVLAELNEYTDNKAAGLTGDGKTRK